LGYPIVVRWIAVITVALVACGRVDFHAAGDAGSATLTISDVTASAFTATVTGAADSGALVLYYCDETLTAHCDALTGSSTPMALDAGTYAATVTGLANGDAFDVAAGPHGATSGDNVLTGRTQPADPYYADVVLLMHMDDTNGLTSDRAGHTVTVHG
jgi:hypothetical protein